MKIHFWTDIYKTTLDVTKRKKENIKKHIQEFRDEVIGYDVEIIDVEAIAKSHIYSDLWMNRNFG